MLLTLESVTLYRQDDVGKYFFDLSLTSSDQSIAALFCQELVRFLGFSQTL